MKICAIYLDDLIIFSSTLEEHLDRLDKVLTRLRECNLKLNPKKCKFMQRKVKYVGHICSEQKLIRRKLKRLLVGLGLKCYGSTPVYVICWVL